MWFFYGPGILTALQLRAESKSPRKVSPALNRTECWIILVEVHIFIHDRPKLLFKVAYPPTLSADAYCLACFQLHSAGLT